MNNANRVEQCEGCGEDVVIKRGGARLCPACQAKARKAKREAAKSREAVTAAPKPTPTYPDEPFYRGL